MCFPRYGSRLLGAWRYPVCMSEVRFNDDEGEDDDDTTDLYESGETCYSASFWGMNERVFL